MENIKKTILRDKDGVERSFPETESISLHYNSQHGMNIHNPNSVPNNWSAGCVVQNGKSPAGVILEEAGHVFSQGSLYEKLMKSAEPSIGSLGGDVGGAEPPTITVTANDMADELEALPKSLKDEMDAEEIIGELRRQGDEVAVTIDNPRYHKFEWNLMGNMQTPDPNNGNINLPGGGFITQEFIKHSQKLEEDFANNILFGENGTRKYFGGVDPVNLGNADSVIAMGMAIQSNINQIK